MLEYVNLDLALGQEEYRKRLRPLQQRLYELEHAVFDAKVPVIIVFEGWAATGKGRLISLLVERLDPRGFRVVKEILRAVLDRVSSKLRRSDVLPVPGGP